MLFKLFIEGVPNTELPWMCLVHAAHFLPYVIILKKEKQIHLTTKTYWQRDVFYCSSGICLQGCLLKTVVEVPFKNMLLLKNIF